jgi:ketosteroid isomerase-like protein
VSEANVELVRAIYDRLRAGDLEGGLALIDREFEGRDRPELPDPQVYRGHQGVLDSLRASFAEFDSVDFVPEEFIDAGDRVVVVFRFQGIGRGSGVRIDERLHHVWTVRGGKAVRMEARSGRPET